jgi:chromosome segregation ATPase
LRSIPCLTKLLFDSESDVHKLQLQIDRVQQERLEIEQRAAEQAETTRQLSEANDTLSARALALAQEAATAGDGARRQLDTQLADLKAALAKAQEEAAVLQERNMTMTFQQAEMYVDFCDIVTDMMTNLYVQGGGTPEVKEPQVNKCWSTL